LGKCSFFYFYNYYLKGEIKIKPLFLFKTIDKKRTSSFLVCVYCFVVGFENLEDSTGSSKEG
jgi:hypothetical protein